jgi:acetyl-CoA synthetase
VVDKHKVNIFYTAPTAIRALMGAPATSCEEDLAQVLRCWGRSASRSTRKPGTGITRSSARSRCPIVDTWWQTETGGILITPLPGATAQARLGDTAVLRRAAGAGARQRAEGCARRPTEGNLCITDSWPGQMRTVYGDHERFEQTYFSTTRACTSPATAAAATPTAITGSPAASMT